MPEDSVKQAAQEYLAERLSEDGLAHEQTLNRNAAIALAPAVWKNTVATVMAIVEEWNKVTREQSLTCKETMLGDLRIRCTGISHQLTIHFDSAKLSIKIENTARPEHEPRVVLSIEGYATPTGREARLMRNREVVNFQMLILGQLRLLTGLTRRPEQ